MLIAQISDLHLLADGQLYADLVPSNAMALAAVEHLNGLVPRPELVLITGDIVEDGSDEAYETSRRILAKLESRTLLFLEITMSGARLLKRSRITLTCRPAAAR
jgi:Icc protein